MKLRLFFLLFFIQTLTLSAAIKPASLFTDHMVLQRNVGIPVWGVASPGEFVTVKLNKNIISQKADSQGNFMIELPKQKAGGPYKLEISGTEHIIINDVYVGDVWLCSGQSNMDMTVAKEDRYWCGVDNEAEEVAAANFPLIRVFDVEFTPTNLVQKQAKGVWEVCSPQTVGHFSAAAYFFARDIFNRYKVPVGLITSAYGASTAEAWISKEALESHPNLMKLLDVYHQKFQDFTKDSAALMTKYREGILKYKGDLEAAKASAGDVNAAPRVRAPKDPNPEHDQHNPYVCYNGMIAPLVPYAIRGALWYQGESNGPTAGLYREIMETLIADWRSKWRLEDFPFLYVQLANNGKAMTEPVQHNNMMTVREAQLQNLAIPNTAMVVAIENAKDNPTNIHPKNKQDIGKWLALAARAKAYNEKIEYSGPLLKNYKIKKNKIVLSFDHIGSGLIAKDGILTGFAICGDDKNWVWADARIKGKTVVVSSEKVPNPTGVRYCWGTNPPASLKNKEGLWAPHFRTDNW